MSRPLGNPLAGAEATPLFGASAGRFDAGQCRPEGPACPQAASPQAKREAVQILMTERAMGVVRACWLVGISRSLFPGGRSASEQFAHAVIEHAEFERGAAQSRTAREARVPEFREEI